MTMNDIKRLFSNDFSSENSLVFFEDINGLENMAAMEWRISNDWERSRLLKLKICMETAVNEIKKYAKLKSYLIFIGFHSLKSFESKWHEGYAKKYPKEYFVKKILGEEMSDNLMTFLSNGEFHTYESNEHCIQWWHIELSENTVDDVVFILKNHKDSFVISLEKFISDDALDEVLNELLIPIAFPCNRKLLYSNLLGKISIQYFSNHNTLLLFTVGEFDEPDTSVIAIGSQLLLNPIQDGLKILEIVEGN